MKKKNKRQQQYYWDLVKGCEYELRLSITLFSCLELQYVSYTNGISARHYVPESDDDIWKYLPNTALLNIFCKSELKDRLQSIPLVCKSWKYVTDDPRCWSSMIPDSVLPEHAFIKKTTHPFKFKSCRLNLPKHYRERDGILRLRTLIDKSKGGAAITTLYLSPFFSYVDYIRSHTDGAYNAYNEILHLISNCCPNLKHISFDVSGPISKETLGRLFKSCKKLELIDFSGYYKFYHLSAIEVLGRCCLPNLQGIRISGFNCHLSAVSIAKYLPQLKLLSFQSDSINSEDLSIILVGCLKLQYLHVHECMRPRLRHYGDNILRQAYSQIPEFHYDDYHEYPWSPESYDHYHSTDGSELAIEDELDCLEDYDYYCTDYYDNILQQREVKKEYDYMFQPIHDVVSYYQNLGSTFLKGDEERKVVKA